MLLLLHTSVTVRSEHVTSGKENFPCVAEAQTPEWLWPVEGKAAGDDILYRPQDYILGELNYSNLFIATEEGTRILCPADAEVASMYLIYYPNLTQSYSFGYSGDFEKDVRGIREGGKIKSGEWSYVTGDVVLRLKDGRNLLLCGFVPARAFKTGEKIRKGQAIGTAHYSYRGIKRSSLLVHCYGPGGVSDPMAPFGLKSTFIAPKKKELKWVLSREEAEADVRQFAEAIKNIYPQLEDLIAPAAFDALVEKELAALPDSLDANVFFRLMMRLNHVVHDSHISVTAHRNVARANTGNWILPLSFAKFGDSVIVSQAVEGKRHYIGRPLKAVDGIPVNEIVAEAKRFANSYDGQIESVTERALATKLYSYYQHLLRETKAKGDTVRYEFADGEKLTLPMPRWERRDYYGDWASQLAFYRRNRWKDSHHHYAELDDKTAYIGLSSFHITEVETDSVVALIRQAEERKIPNLVLDLRNNGGGHVEVMNRIIGCFLNAPDKETGGYNMINSRQIRGTQNFIAEDTTLFADYHPLPGKKGFYQLSGGEPLRPDADTHYSGRLYVLINSASCSAASELAGCMARNRRGFIIGRESGTTYHYMKALKFAHVELANSAYSIRIPVVKMEKAARTDGIFPYHRGVMPNKVIPLTWKEIYQNEGRELKADPVIRETMECIDAGIYL